MPPRRRSKAANLTVPVESPPQVKLGDYVFTYGDQFRTSCGELAENDRARLLAWLPNMFERAWKSSESRDDLSKLFNYKILNFNAAKDEKVFQVHVLGRSGMRVAMIELPGEHPPLVVYLHAYRKNNNNDSDYTKAANRAQDERRKRGIKDGKPRAS